jgi:hypothetical protein
MFDCIVMGEWFAVGIATDRLENHVEIALDAKPGAQGRDVDVMWPQVMEHGCAGIEERLDINQRPRPIALAENSFTLGKATRPDIIGIA